MEKNNDWIAEEKELEKRVLAEYLPDEVRKHFEYLTTLTRRAGTEDELKAANYIKQKLDEYGVDAEVYDINAYISLPGEADIEVLSPVVKSIPCLPRTFIPSTPAGGLKAELVSLGKGLEQDYQGQDVRGKIVLVEPAYREGRLEVALIAEQKGAIAQIHVTPGTSQAMAFGQLRFAWGNPTPETIDKVAKIPAVSIRNSDGMYLAELTKTGPVVVRLKADVWRGYRNIKLPMGFVTGEQEPEKFVLFGGHYCSWFLGASDNAVANSLMLEMARIFQKHRKHLRRSIRFAWWSGHEQGTFAGSTWYGDNFWDDIRDNAIAYLVIDGLGRAGSEGFVSESTYEIRRFQELLIKELLGLKVESKQIARIGEQSFWGMGLPSFTGKPDFTGDKTAALWYSHTAEDTPDKVDMELIKIPFKVHTISLLRLCNTPILPFEFVTVAKQFKKGLDNFPPGDKSLLNLTSLMTQAERLQEKAMRLDNSIAVDLLTVGKQRADGETKGKLAVINACLMELSRVLIPVLFTKAGKYGQDPYPVGAKLKPIPALQPLEKLGLMDRNSEEYKALRTFLLRERNRVSDALSSAIHILDDTLSKI